MEEAPSVGICFVVMKAAKLAVYAETATVLRLEHNSGR